LNKQRYLAELQQLLVFMSEEDRELTVHRYAALFDQAGEDGEAELIGTLGSPTKTAIQLSRGYEPGKVEANLPPLEQPKAPEKQEPTVPAQETLWDDLPDFEPPALDSDLDTQMQTPTEPISQAVPAEEPAQSQAPVPSADEEETAPVVEADIEATAEQEPVSAPDGSLTETETETSAEKAPLAEENTAPEPEAVPEPEPEAEAASEDGEEPWHKEPKAKKPKREKKEKTPKPAPIANNDDYKPIPRPLGIALLVLVLVALGLPLAALFLGVMIVLVIPGAAGLVCAYLAAVGGLWCLSFLADTVMMFGLAFLLLALALIVLWVGIWADIHLVRLYISGVQWLAGELLERQVTEDE
jgi:uncharacterized membrane protein